MRVCCISSSDVSGEFRERPGPFADDSARATYGPHAVLVPVHTSIDLAIDNIGIAAASGSVTHSIRNPRQTQLHAPAPAIDELLSSIVLDAVSLSIEAVACADTGAILEHTYDGQRLTVRWASPFGPHETRRVQIKYSVESPICGLYFHGPDADNPDRVPHCITDHETEKARHWLPCVDHPSVRTSLDFRLTAPKEYKAIANGIETGVVDNGDGTSTTTYALEAQCPSYLICFAVGDFTELIDESVDGMPIRYYAPRNVSEDMLRINFGRTPAMVRWLQRKVGVKFPWPKYYQIGSPEIDGGAMENISFVTFTTRLFVDESSAAERQHYMDSVNIHEMAHTYFGDLLVCKHFDHSWLKESWATYMQTCWIEDHSSHEDMRLSIIQAVDEYISETKSFMRPIVTRVYNSSWDMFDSHLYPGGAVRIHMLRHLLGEETFWPAVKDYVNTFAGKSVETDDFKRVLEQHSGLNLTRFFDQWFHSPGFPKLRATHEVIKQGDSTTVQVTIEQTQASKEKGVSLFDIVVECDVIDDSGIATTTKVVFEDGRAKAVGFARLPPGRKFAFLEIDPRGKILCSLEFNPGEQVLEAMATSGRDIGTRIHAYRTLIEIGSCTALKKVKINLANELFHGVRMKVYESLSKAPGSLQSIDILASSILTETHAVALHHLLKNLKLRHPKIRASLIQILARPPSELGHFARRFAIDALGDNHNPLDHDLLLRIATDTPAKIGGSGAVRAAAITALGAIRTQEGYEHLLRIVPRSSGGACDEDRMAAIKGLAAGWMHRSRLDRQRAIEVVAECLLDPHRHIRTAAVNGLAGLEASEYHEAAKGTLRLVPEQERKDMAYRVRCLGESRAAAGELAGGRAVDLARAVEGLEEKIMKLEFRLRVMEERMALEAEPKDGGEHKQSM